MTVNVLTCKFYKYKIDVICSQKWIRLSREMYSSHYNIARPSCETMSVFIWHTRIFSVNSRMRYCDPVQMFAIILSSYKYIFTVPFRSADSRLKWVYSHILIYEIRNMYVVLMVLKCKSLVLTFLLLIETFISMNNSAYLFKQFYYQKHHKQTTNSAYTYMINN